MKKNKKISILIAALILFVCIIVACVIYIRNTTQHNLTYEEYNALSAEEQEEYFNSFDNIEDYFEWYNKVKKEYEEEIGKKPNIDIGGAEKNE